MSKICEICGKETIISSKCSDCWDKEYKQAVKDEIVSGEEIETFREDKIFCPWCGEVHEIDDYYDLYDGGDHEIECQECEKDFTVSTEIIYKFSTRRN